MIVCMCNLDGLDVMKQLDFVEAERGITVNKFVQRRGTHNLFRDFLASDAENSLLVLHHDRCRRR
jgi:hypothetical protein